MAKQLDMKENKTRYKDQPNRSRNKTTYMSQATCLAIETTDSNGQPPERKGNKRGELESSVGKPLPHFKTFLVMESLCIVSLIQNTFVKSHVHIFIKISKVDNLYAHTYIYRCTENIISQN